MFSDTTHFSFLLLFSTPSPPFCRNIFLVWVFSGFFFFFFFRKGPFLLSCVTCCEKPCPNLKSTVTPVSKPSNVFRLGRMYDTLLYYIFWKLLLLDLLWYWFAIVSHFKLMNKSNAVHESLAFLKSGEKPCGISHSPYFLFGMLLEWAFRKHVFCHPVLYGRCCSPDSPICWYEKEPFWELGWVPWPQRDDTSHTFRQRSQRSRLELLGIFKRMCKQNQRVALQCFLWSVMKS